MNFENQSMFAKVIIVILWDFLLAHPVHVGYVDFHPV